MNGPSEEQIRYYRAHGFLRVRGIIGEDEARRAREAADQVLATGRERPQSTRVFRQFVNTWRSNDVLKALTFHRVISAAATALAGVPLRLWHDQLLVKEPHNEAPTHFHQDQPFWPHSNSLEPITCWVALDDVPVERGCMTFISGSHHAMTYEPQNVNRSDSLFALVPELAWDERVTLPLRAGDCTFHHGRTAHMANANSTDKNRYGFAIIFMDAATTYNGTAHVVTDPLREAGEITLSGELNHAMFPVIS